MRVRKMVSRQEFCKTLTENPPTSFVAAGLRGRTASRINQRFEPCLLQPGTGSTEQMQTIRTSCVAPAPDPTQKCLSISK
jgi:hypothetical protein